MRKRIFEIIEIAEDNDRISHAYDCFMMVVIIVSMIPLAFKSQHHYLSILDKITVAIFIVDYLLRLFVADLKLDKGTNSFLIYPFTPMALIDLVSILPSITIINSGFKLLKVIRLFRAFRAFRVFKAFRYSKNISIILAVFRKQKTLFWWYVGLLEDIS